MKKSARKDRTSIFNITVGSLLVCYIIFLALLGIHEIGHIVVGSSLGCSGGKAIIYDITEATPYATMLCPPGTPIIYITFSGLFFTLVLSSLFYMMGAMPEKKLVYFAYGLSFLIAATDMGFIFGSDGFYMSMLIGFVGVAYGLIEFSRQQQKL